MSHRLLPILFVLQACLDACILWEKSVANVRCRICRRNRDDDSLLLCDGCNSGFHLYCLRPPLHSIPRGDWFCVSCKPPAPAPSSRALAAAAAAARKNRRRQVESESGDEESGSSEGEEEGSGQESSEEEQEQRPRGRLRQRTSNRLRNHQQQQPASRSSSRSSRTSLSKAGKCAITIITPRFRARVLSEVGFVASHKIHCPCYQGRARLGP